MKKVYKMEDFWGGHISNCIDKAKEVSIGREELVQFVFNGIQVFVDADTDSDLLQRDLSTAYLLKWSEIGPNPVVEYDFDTLVAIEEATREQESRQAKQRAIWDAEEKAKREALELKIKDIEFDVVNPDALKSWEDSNPDSYGGSIVNYAKNWGRLMQTEISLGKILSDIASDTSHQADTEGLTGFMYGAAVNILSTCWKHGEELRKWHNKEYNHEGDGVVNPAILTIKS